MSDPRIESAKDALARGAFDQVIQTLKPLLAEMPENMEVRSILTEAQEGMMLRLQLSQKVAKASELLKNGDTAGARKAVEDVLKLDPTNPEALDIQRVFSAPPIEDLSSTIGFDMTEPLLEGQPAAQQMQGQEPGGLDSLEDFSLPLSDLQQQFPDSPAETTKSSPPLSAPLQDLGPMELEDFGGAAVSGMEDFSGSSLPAMEAPGGMIPPAGAFPSTDSHAESTVLSSDAAVPFSLGGEGGKVDAFISEGKALIASGKYQEAIDVLTRVFILDEENQEAQRLIDQAKELETNREREINVILNEAISAYDSKDIDKAKSLFQKVLSIFPGHREADYYMKEIEGSASAPVETAAPAFQLETAGSSGFELESGPSEFSFDASAAGASDGDLASLVGSAPAPAPPPPPAPSAAPVSEPQFPPPAGPAPFKPQAATQKGKPKNAKKVPVGMIAMIIGGLLLVSSLFIVGPILSEKFFSPKPKAMSIPPAKPPKKGNEAAQKPVIPAQPAQPQRSLPEIVAEAKKAVEEKQFDKAVNLYIEAEKIDKNDLDIKMSLQNAREALARQQEEAAKNQKFITDFEKASQYFKMQEYGEALRLSWRLIYPDDTLAKQMGKADTIRKIIKNGYYNWGVKELKAGNAAAASKNFKDLVELPPAFGSDPKGRDLLDFSKKYSNSPVDEKYRSYVQDLSYRSIED